MSNPYLPRPIVHEWSEAIGEDQGEGASITRLLKQQRRLSRFIEENSENLGPASGGVCLYLTGVIARLFDKAGGRLRSATWEQVRGNEKRVQSVVGELLPLDDGLVGRARAVSWRAQPHILDEALMALFESDAEEREEDLEQVEALKVYLLLWVATEVLDACWRPPKDFEGESDYAYHHIDPKKIDKDG